MMKALHLFLLKYKNVHILTFCLIGRKEAMLAYNYNPFPCPQVKIENGMVGFGDMMKIGAGGVLQQMFGNMAKSLDGKTGSWERMLEVAKLRHKKGPQPGLIAARIADFIGLWASATGDVASLRESPS
jgi:hypothetical protein